MVKHPGGRSAFEIRSFTCILAWSLVTPSSKTSLIYDKPNMLVERKLIFFCTGFIEISIGIVMNFSISSALRPGHCVMMVISVFVTSGNASIGIFLNVIMPITNKQRVANSIKNFRFKEKARTDLRIFNMKLFFGFNRSLLHKSLLHWMQ
jgi:hypothetical protein